jgi:peptide-methionine (S)-S-oxide reductase
MGDHTEAISIDYDPDLISYSELLDYFWEGHRCDRNNASVQYQNAVFYRNDEQKELAETALKSRAASLGITPEKVATKIIPVKTFTYAEKYHQKYSIRGEIREVVDSLYPDAKSLADSTVATRLNAYLGNGIDHDTEKFLNELSDYGLPQAIEDAVRIRVEN